jgi:tetratricopeptide (TPR) repeat protein
VTSLLLIAVSGMDWPGFAARLGRGELPNLAALRQRGASGWLAAATPRDGPAAFASLATGRLPEEHGVLRPLEPWAGGLRAAGIASWRAPPLWARLEAAGRSTGSAGWPALRSGAAWAGVHIDDRYALPTAPKAQDWALPLRCAPEPVREAIRDVRVHPSDITAAMLRPLVPSLDEIDQTRDAGLPRLAMAMARAASLQGAAAWLLRGPRPEAVFVHQPWLADVRRAFEGEREGPFAQAVDGAWRFLDGLVGHLVELAGPDALTAVVSPGWRSRTGLLVAAGPGVRPGEVEGADLLDLAPTVLARFGLEDQSLPGRPIAALAADGPRAPAPALEPAAPVPADPALLQAAIDAGFRPAPSPPPSWQAQGLAELALILLERAPAQAAEAASAALKLQPEHLLALRVLALAHIFLEQPDPLPELAQALLAAAPDRGWGALAHGACHVLRGQSRQAVRWLRQAEQDPEADTLLAVGSAWYAAARPADAARVFEAVLRIDPSSAAAEIGLGMAAAARRDFVAAESALQRALDHDPGRPAAYLQLAQLYARTARPGLAARAAESARRFGAPQDAADAAREGRLGG